MYWLDVAVSTVNLLEIWLFHFHFEQHTVIYGGKFFWLQEFYICCVGVGRLELIFAKRINIAPNRPAPIL